MAQESEKKHIRGAFVLLLFIALRELPNAVYGYLRQCVEALGGKVYRGKIKGNANYTSHEFVRYARVRP